MSALFEPVRIGALEARNRVVRSATWLGMADERGRATGELVDRYAALGRGGAGIVITGYTAVDPAGRQMPRMLGAWADDQVPGLARVARALAETGATAGVQLVHAGGQTRSAWIGGASPVAPSFVDVPQYPEMPRELSAEGVAAAAAAFGRAAERVRRAGFAFVQIHAAHGYLVNQFLSPATNHRTDRYGGDLRGRFRFLQEVLAAVAAAAGPDFPVAVKLSGADFVPGGFEAGEAARVAGWLGARGIAFVEVSGGTPASGRLGPVRPGVAPGEGEAYFRDLARRVRLEAGCAVAAVGGLRSPEVLEELLVLGEADLVALSRPLIREPDLPARWQRGDRSPAACVSCNGCFGPGRAGHGVRCVRPGGTG